MRLVRSLAVLALCLVAAPAAFAADRPTVRWEPIPADHFNRGRGRQTIDMIVIHTVEGSLGSCLATFRGPTKVSAHYVVGRDGRIVQCVNDADTAWHAGGVNGHSLVSPAGDG